ncbi:MAG: transporter substrate-binding domain-containing protein [Planctomycetes bacterium]|nr:transporter substrate-binding domain-containing protein [Planctomycetota bacterium]
MLVLTGSLAAADPVTLITEDIPPFNYVDPAKPDAVTGVCTEIVRAIMARSGHHDRIQMMPWARGYAQLQTGPRVALFATARLPEREHLFRWVGPLAHKHFAFIAPAGSPLHMTTVDDARRVSAIGVYRDSAKQRWLLTHGFTNLEAVDDEAANLRLLTGGRIPLWFTAEPECYELARRQGIEAGQLAIALRVEVIPLYLAVSRDVEESTVAAWQQTCDTLRLDGTIAALTRRFIPTSCDLVPAAGAATGAQAGTLIPR